MSTAPRKEERRISSENIVLSYCKGNLLYLIFREAIDEDMPPLPGDFTIIDRARPVPIVDLQMLQAEDTSIVVLQLKDRIRPGHETGVRYKPTLWLMCWQESGEEVGVFEQSVFPEGHNAVDLSKFGEHEFEDIEPDDDIAASSQADTAKACKAELGYVCDFRIQVKFTPGVDTSSAPNIDDFRAEMHDRWLKITSVKFFHVEHGVASDIILALSEPMDVGSVVNLAYKSPNKTLVTPEGNPVASFNLSAKVGESPQSFIKGGETATHLDDDIPGTAGPSTVETSNIAQLRLDEHRPAEPEISLDDDLPVLDMVVEEDELTPPSRPEDVDTKAKSQDARSAANDEDEALQEARARSQKQQADQQQNQQKKTPAPEEKAPEEKEVKIVGQKIDYSSITPSIPGGLVKPNAKAQKVEGVSDDTSAKAVKAPKLNAALEKAITKSLYVAPIAIFAWVFLVVVVYAGYMIFGYSNSSIAKPELMAGQQESTSQPAQQAQAGGKQTCDVTAEDGGHYTGECVNGVFEGHGVFTWPSGNKYDGMWKNGKQHGVGKLMYNNGAVYTGEFAEGVEHGGGLMRWPNGSSYQGGYDKGIFHGQGEYKSIDGTRYVGRFERGMMTQEGTCFMKNGNQTQGPCGQGGRR
ncbi:hypothetical protein TDB9533_04300 [Thalassocella blandensis]|nr:hypothetical protein TDB9533_04300 [Thalassocella blandensis]